MLKDVNSWPQGELGLEDNHR